MNKKVWVFSVLTLVFGLYAVGSADALTTSQIKQAQRDLKTLGYYPAYIDGIVGPITRRAVVQYQYEMELPVSGNLDEPTVNSLRRPALILNTQDFAPFHYQTTRKGEARGPIPQVVKQVCQKAGINCRIVLYDQWRVAQEVVKSGQAHGMFVIAWNSERAKWLHRSDAIVETGYGLFVRQDDGLQFDQILKQPAVLEGYTVGVYGPSGTATSLKKLKTAIDSRGVKIFINMEGDDKPLFQKLSASKGRYAVYSNQMVGETIIKGMGLSNLRFAGMHRGLSYYVGFSKSRVPLSVVQRFNAAYASMVRNGEVLAIMANYSMPTKKSGQSATVAVKRSVKTNPVLPQRFNLQNLNGRPVVVDKRACLMWQQAGNYRHSTWAEALAYVEKLNEENFAGFSDWRIPDIGELNSLVEKEIQKKNRMYIHSIFDTLQQSCWSANKTQMDVQFVDFYDGAMGSKDQNDTNFVRAVRSMPDCKSSQ